MIDHQYKCIFIHIHKNAGTSVESAFGHPLYDHSLPEHIITKVGWDVWKSYLKFAIIRNPWDRAVSNYFFNRKVGIGPARNMEFKQWLSDAAPLLVRQKDYLTYQGEICVDVILRFERLRRDFAALCKRIGANIVLPHLNRSSHEYYTYYYDQETIDLVYKVYHWDVDTFGYKHSIKHL